MATKPKTLWALQDRESGEIMWAGIEKPVKSKTCWNLRNNWMPWDSKSLLKLIRLNYTIAKPKPSGRKV